MWLIVFFQVVRSATAVVGISVVLAVACVAAYVTSFSRPNILVASAVPMDMVPLKAAGNNMPVVYVMEPVQSDKQNAVLSYPSSATQLAQVKPASLSDLPVSVAFPLPQGVLNAKSTSSTAVQTKKSAVVNRARQARQGMPVPTAQDLRFQNAYPVETEKQAERRAKVLARQEYLKTYQTAIQANILSLSN